MQLDDCNPTWTYLITNPKRTNKAREATGNFRFTSDYTAFFPTTRIDFIGWRPFMVLKGML